MDTRSKSKTKSIDTELETDAELEEQLYISHLEDDRSGSEDTEEDNEEEESATDGGKVKPSVCPCRHQTDSPPDSPPPPSFSLLYSLYRYLPNPTSVSSIDGWHIDPEPSTYLTHRSGENSEILQLYGALIRT